MSVNAAMHRAAVARLLIDERLKERERWVSVWHYVLSSELERGTRFLRAEPGGKLYVVLGDDHRILSLPRPGAGGDQWHSYFANTYGYGEREKLAKFVYDAVRSYAFDYGTVVELRRFAVWNQATKTCYMSSYNGQMFKIGDEVATEPQGTDGVFFADDDDGVHCAPDIGDHGILIDRLCSPNFLVNTPSGITPDQQKKALIIWLFALAFPDLLPTKPILLLEGVKGSGKTSVVTLIQQALLGNKRPMILQRNKEDDFGVVLLKKPIALFDNQDTYVDWIPDAICSYATAGVWTKRKLYSDDESLTIKPHAFVAISTRNPASYRRDDVVDRCVILRFDRRSEFTRASALDQEILNDRPRLLGEYLWYVQRIVDQLRQDSSEETTAEVHRMADFAAFGRIIARVFDWTKEDLDGVMTALQAERDAFLNEEDPLIDLLHDWIKHRNGGLTNIGRAITAFDLHSQLETFAQIRSLPWKESPRTLANKLRSTHIERDFRVEATTLNGHKAFRLWRHNDAKLAVVMDTNAAPEFKIKE